MSKQDGDSRPLEDIPDVDGIIIVSSKQQATLKQEVTWLLNQLLPFDFLFMTLIHVLVHSFNKQCFSAHYIPGIVVCPGDSKRRKHSCWPLWRVLVGGLTHVSLHAVWKGL